MQLESGGKVLLEKGGEGEVEEERERGELRGPSPATGAAKLEVVDERLPFLSGKIPRRRLLHVA